MLAPILVASLLAATALAAPVLAPGPSAHARTMSHAPTALCTPGDAGRAELAGLGVRGGVLLAAPDGGESVRVHLLDPRTCAPVVPLQAQQDPFDVEDVAVGSDGTVWLAAPGPTLVRRGGELRLSPTTTSGASAPVTGAVVVTAVPAATVAAAAPASTTPSAPGSPLKAPGTTSSQGIAAWQAAIIAVLVAGALVWLVGLGRRRRR